jgi:hypothetical protein
MTAVGDGDGDGDGDGGHDERVAARGPQRRRA